MKKLTLLTAITLTSLSAYACTVTVGEKFDDDDDIVDDADDDDFVDDADFVDDSDEDASDGETDESDEVTSNTTDEETSEDDTSSGTNTPPNADAGEPTAADSSTDETTTSSVAPTTSDESTSSDPVNPSDPFAAECNPPGEAYSCAECLHFNCSAQWYTCCGEPGCVETWHQITACVADAMSDSAIMDVDNCAAEAAGGDQIDLSETVQDLMSCVASEFMGDPDDDPLYHQPGDGTCTFACYNVATLFPDE